MKWQITITAPDFGLHVYQVDARDASGAILIAMAQHVGEAREVRFGLHPDAGRLYLYQLRYGPVDNSKVTRLWAKNELDAHNRLKVAYGDEFIRLYDCDRIGGFDE